MYGIQKDWYESKDVQELIAVIQKVLENHGLTKITFDSGYDLTRYFDKNGKPTLMIKTGLTNHFHLVKEYESGSVYEMDL